jgi:hypothetical protein
MQLIVGLETPTNFSFEHEMTLREKYGMRIERDGEVNLALVSPHRKKIYDATESNRV